jgi:Clp amino terminal domain, pathogenicity island component/ClpX C4-type zinc finger
MFERFTDRARRVVVLAQEEARLLNHNYIGTEHILLGLIHEGEGVAAKALESLGISLEAVRNQVEEIIGQGGSSPSGHIPFTPRAKKVLELSLREALQLGHNYIGTEHILLGLLREGEGVAAQVLVKQGVELGGARQAVIQLLSGYAGSAEGLASSVAATSIRVQRRTAGPGPLSAFGAQPAGRRCSFCLRSEDRVTWLVRGRSAWICDECLARASDLVAEAGEGDPKQLRLRPPFVPQAQTEAAEVGVERAFETVFGGDATVDERLALIEDSGPLRAVLEQVMEVGRRAGDPDIWVDSVRFISTDEAEVHWSPTLVGGGRIPLHGFAVLDAGVWKVSRTTFQQMASMAGVSMPSPDPDLPDDDPEGP